MWSCKVADMVADLEVYMVIDMEVDKVGDMVICVGHTAWSPKEAAMSGPGGPLDF